MFRKVSTHNLTLTQEDKPKKLYIHAVDDAHMNKIIAFIKQVLNYDDIENIKPRKVKTKDVLKGLDWTEELPEYKISSVLYDKSTICIHYSLNDTSLIDAIKSKFNVNRVINSACWIPERPSKLYEYKNMVCVSLEKIVPKYPIYIITKGRATTGTTAFYLDECGIDYKIVVEPKEVEDYLQNGYKKENILVAPENFSERRCGGIPVRNFVWEHSISMGAKKHWILDDNIRGYYRTNLCQRTPIKSGAIFRIVEDYSDRYTNMKMSGHNYSFFAVPTDTKPALYFNTHVYSSILLSNDIYPEYAWRGTYNEDVDLNIRLLKSGYMTALFNNITANKAKTMTTKGGNTDTIYSVEDAHLKKTMELVNAHPDVVKCLKKFKRWHHQVDWSKFEHLKPIWCKNYQKPDDYNLVYEQEYHSANTTEEEEEEEEDD